MFHGRLRRQSAFRGILHFRRRQGVFNQAGDGHRAGATRHRGDVPRDRRNFFKQDVAAYSVRGVRDTDVDDDRARFDAFGGDQPRCAGCGDQDIGAATDLV